MNTLLSDRNEGIVRLVHAMGRASMEDVLSGWLARPMTPQAARRAMEVLESLGWLCRLRMADSRRIYWAVTEDAVPHLLSSARLPRQPTDWVAADEDAPAAAPAPATARVSTSAPLPPPWRGMPGAVYVPPPAAPMREGATDYLRYASRGLRC